MGKPIECKGREWKEFYSSPWGPDAYHDGSYVQVNGKDVDDDYDLSTVQDEDSVRVHYGDLYGVEGHTDLAEFLAAWLKGRTLTTLVIEVAKEKEASVREAVVALGAKVV